ncbi:hypothetical protein T484DRAFT_1796575 [Baffinella frigidus]|nr:hypothetical protein T484DRAFT_1796575 [Cryptophyta sp. CCMP2293]
MAEATPMGSVVRAGSFKKTGSFRRNSSKVGRSAEPREVNSAEDLLLALLQDMGPLTLEEVEDGVVLPEQIEAHSIEIRAPKPHVQFFEFCARLSTSRLTSLSITDCQAGPKQAEALGRGISTKMQLKRLVLRGNCIMSEGALLLSRAIAGIVSAAKLTGNEHLRSLDLDDNGIGPDVPPNP